MQYGVFPSLIRTSSVKVDARESSSLTRTSSCQRRCWIMLNTPSGLEVTPSSSGWVAELPTTLPHVAGVGAVALS